MQKTVLLLAIVIGSIGESLAGQTISIPRQPLGFKFKDGWTLKWAEGTEALVSHFPAGAYVVDCERDNVFKNAQAVGGDALCTIVSDTFLPKPLRNCNLRFRNNKFWWASCGYHSYDFHDLESALRTKLGDPQSRQNRPLENGYGAVFDNMTDVWEIGSVEASLSECDTNDGGSLVGSLDLTYKPIETTIPQLQHNAEAPF